MKIGVTSEPLLIVICLLIATVALSGCTSNPINLANATSNSTINGYVNTSNQQNNQTTQSEVSNQSGEYMAYHNASNPIVTFVTTKGTFKAKIFLDKAPITSNNFLNLVRSRFYNNLTFHRYVPGFVIQGGDPRGDGTGGSNQTIPLEIVSGLTHVKGALGMARSSDPNSASSQFYVALDDIHQLDGSYAVFGQVVDGMDVVMQLRQGDRMTNVTIS